MAKKKRGSTKLGGTEPVTHKLFQPVSWGKETVQELTFNPPKARHLKALPAKPRTEHLLDLAAKLCGQAPRFIDELGMNDTMAIVEIVESFFPDGQVTGDSGLASSPTTSQQ